MDILFALSARCRQNAAKEHHLKNRRIGIFSGTFDPIHIGHIEACLVSKGAFELDKVLVMIEKKPKRKEKVSDYKHRMKMAELALADFDSIELFDTGEDNVTFTDTPTHLQKKFPGCQFIMITGSDMLAHMSEWPGFEEWANSQSIGVVLRSNSEEASVKKIAKEWSKKYPKLQLSVLPAVWSPVSSSKIRNELSKSKHSDLVHRNVMNYIHEHKVY